MTPETATTLNYFILAYWVIGILTIGGHLLKAYGNEPGDWKEFFADKKNITYLLYSAIASVTLLTIYAVNVSAWDVNAILYASTVSFGVGSAARGASQSEAAKERKVEMKRAQAAHDAV